LGRERRISQLCLFWTSSLPAWIWLTGEMPGNKPLHRVKKLFASSLCSAEQGKKIGQLYS